MNHLFLIVLILAVLSIIILFLFLLFAWSAKKTLVRGETAWSAKNIPIKRSKNITKKDRESSLLESISIQTRDYLISEEEGKVKYKDK